MSITVRALASAALAGAVMLHPIASVAGPKYEFKLETSEPQLRTARGSLRLTDEAFEQRLVDDFFADIKTFDFLVIDKLGTGSGVTKATCTPQEFICLADFFVSADGALLLGGPGSPDLRVGDANETLSMDAANLDPLWEGSFGSEGGICSVDPDDPDFSCEFTGRWVLKVPEPSTLALLGAGLGGFVGFRPWRRAALLRSRR